MIRISALIIAFLCCIAMLYCAYSDQVGLTIAFAALMVINHNVARNP